MTVVVHTASPCLFMLRRFAPSLRTPGALQSPIGWQRGTSFADTRTKKRDPLPGPRSFLLGLPGAASTAEAASAAA